MRRNWAARLRHVTTDGPAAAVPNGTALVLGPHETKVSRLRAEVLA
ncbi:hypothetical protein [Nonomuraea sp. NPDC002799]